MKNRILTKAFIIKVIKVALISAITNAVLLALVKPLSGVPDTFSPFFYSNVIWFTILGVLAAAAVYVAWGWLLPRRELNRDFTIIAWLALFISFIPDLMMPFSTDRDNIGATPFVVGILIVMHIIPAILVIHSFTGWKSRKHSALPAAE